jgi:hypothetical protein
MRRLIFSCLVILAPTLWADNVWTLVPQGRLFPITFADPREIRTMVAFTDTGKIQTSVGSYLSLFSVNDEDETWKFHFGLEGRGYLTMRQQGGRFPLETVDGTIGLYAEYAHDEFQYQFRYTHVSAHLADGSTDSPIAFSRETISLRAGYSPNENLHAYVGLYKIVHTMPTVSEWSVQLGTSYFFPLPGQTTPFIAADLRVQNEAAANPCFTLQLGFAMHSKESVRRSFRAYYSYYTGADMRGQYYLQTSTQHSINLEFPL